MLLFNREVRYQIHSGSGLAGSGSEMIYSGSGKKFRIRIHNTENKDRKPDKNSSLRRLEFMPRNLE
jgi:hypothetical protein